MDDVRPARSRDRCWPSSYARPHVHACAPAGRLDDDETCCMHACCPTGGRAPIHACVVWCSTNADRSTIPNQIMHACMRCSVRHIYIYIHTYIYAAQQSSSSSSYLDWSNVRTVRARSARIGLAGSPHGNG